MPLHHVCLSKKANPTKTKQTTQASCSFGVWPEQTPQALQARSTAWSVPLYSSVPYQCRFPIPRHVAFLVFLFGNRILSPSPKCVVSFWQKYPEATASQVFPTALDPFSALFINQLLLMLPHCFLMNMDSKIHGHGGSRVTLMQ